MRAFGLVSPLFWSGTTGQEILKRGDFPALLACYLMTSMHAHMSGLYYLPKKYVCLDLGRNLKVVERGFRELDSLASGAFALYDDASQWVWIPEMMHWQVGMGRPLNAKDDRVRSVIRHYKALPPIPFVQAFYDRYVSEIPDLEKREICPKATGRQRGVDGGLTGGERGVDAPGSLPFPVPVFSSSEGESVREGAEPGIPANLRIDAEVQAATLEPPAVLHQDPPAAPEPVEVLGEYGHVRLTPVQKRKLQEKLGNSATLFDHYIHRFDRWKEENKGVKRFVNRQAYTTIPNWYEDDLAKGKWAETRAGPAVARPKVAADLRVYQPSEEEVNALNEREAARWAGG